MNEKLLERVKKLLALGNSPNEEEAASATAKAVKLLAEAGLSMEDFEMHQFKEKVEAIEESPFTLKINMTDWHKVFYTNVAMIFGGDIIYASFDKYDIPVIIGKPLTIQIIKQTLQYLDAAIERKQKECKGMNKQQYRHGMMASILVKLREKLSGDAACTALAVQDQDALNRFRAGKGVSQRSGNLQKDSYAFARGFMDGRDIGLDDQLEHSSEKEKAYLE